jgi:hypothetical protein
MNNPMVIMLAIDEERGASTRYKEITADGKSVPSAEQKSGILYFKTRALTAKFGKIPERLRLEASDATV